MEQTVEAYELRIATFLLVNINVRTALPFVLGVKYRHKLYLS